MGVTSPNAIGLKNFEEALRQKKSGIRYFPELRELKFSCQIGGKPEISEELLNKYFSPLQQKGLNSSGIIYGVISGIDAWKDAGLTIEESKSPDWETGIIFGTGILGVDKFREAIHLIDQGKTRRLGSTSVPQTMASGISAYLGGMLGCGNQVTTNSSACTTGTEAVLMGFERIQAGRARRMLVGSCADHGPYVWGGFDAMRILPSKFNEEPENASRPMDADASGFVPGSGAGALLLEDLESAKSRGARIYCEILGGEVNSGGQRGEGSMTAANNVAVIRCIKKALENSAVHADEIDAINGHLTATTRDSVEIENWSKALNRKNENFPFINSLKGMTGHCLSASGSIECVSSVLQIHKNFIFGNSNLENIHPEISQLISASQIPANSLNMEVNILAKASFGFGDVNAVVIFKKFKD